MLHVFPQTFDAVHAIAAELAAVSIAIAIAKDRILVISLHLFGPVEQGLNLPQISQLYFIERDLEAAQGLQ